MPVKNNFLIEVTFSTVYKREGGNWKGMFNEDRSNLLGLEFLGNSKKNLPWRDFGFVSVPKEMLSRPFIFGRKVVNVILILVTQATGRLQEKGEKVAVKSYNKSKQTRIGRKAELLKASAAVLFTIFGFVQDALEA